MSFYPKLIGAVCGVCAAGALIYAGVSALDKAGVSTDGILSSKPTLCGIPRKNWRIIFPRWRLNIRMRPACVLFRF